MDDCAYREDALEALFSITQITKAVHIHDGPKWYPDEEGNLLNDYLRPSDIRSGLQPSARTLEKLWIESDPGWHTFHGVPSKYSMILHNFESLQALRLPCLEWLFGDAEPEAYNIQRIVAHVPPNLELLTFDVRAWRLSPRSLTPRNTHILRMLIIQKEQIVPKLSEIRFFCIAILAMPEPLSEVARSHGVVLAVMDFSRGYEEWNCKPRVHLWESMKEGCRSCEKL
ncbi:MAG: hypothetical protein MMC23_005622 [Stictis urceolatum]|nr:hypothetical protein [Stictis urceolata]